MITPETARRMEVALKSILEDEGIPFDHVGEVTIWGVPADHMPSHNLQYSPSDGSLSILWANVHADPGLTRFHISIHGDLDSYHPSMHTDPPKPTDADGNELPF